MMGSGTTADDPDQIFSLAFSEFRAGRVELAEKLCQTAICVDPRHAQSLHLLGVTAAQSGRAEVALAMIARAIDADAAVPEFHNSLGNTLVSLGRRDEAAEAYRKAVAMAPGSAAAHLNLANVLRETGNLGEAIEHYRSALRLRPDNVPALMNLGVVLARAGKFEEAITRFEQVLSRHPQLPEANIHIGHVLAELGRTDEAIARYKIVVTAHPENTAAISSLGHVLQQRGQVGEAVEWYQRAARLSPPNARAHIDLGLALVELGRTEEALAESEAAARLVGAEEFPHFMLGVLLTRCGRPALAREQFEIYLSQEPSDPRGARMCLAAIGYGKAPDRASREMLGELYVLRAGWWDRGPGSSTENLWASLVHNAFREFVSTPESVHVLDAGCGSGVIGKLIAGKAARMTGVDLSPALLERARATMFYDELYQDDLVEFMAGRTKAYDVVTSSAVLVHFGNLEPVFAAAARCLRDEGLFIFTVFDNQDDASSFAVGPVERGYAQTGCYVHGEDYIVRSALACGFAVEALRRGIFDHYEGNAREGLVVVLRRALAPRDDTQSMSRD